MDSKLLCATSMTLNQSQNILDRYNGTFLGQKQKKDVSFLLSGLQVLRVRFQAIVLSNNTDYVPENLWPEPFGGLLERKDYVPVPTSLPAAPEAMTKLAKYQYSSRCSCMRSNLNGKFRFYFYLQKSSSDIKQLLYYTCLHRNLLTKHTKIHSTDHNAISI